MADPLTFSVIFRELLGKFVAPSHNTCEITLNRIQVHLLEMEDVLFHLNSAVMMPERPMGKTSTKTSEDQDKISGLQTLAISFKQFEFDPRKRMLISGHSDTSGEVELNFELSDERASNVLYLLKGDRESWAEVSERRHRIEDYQQIMKFINANSRWGWPCDPGEVDNKWGKNTRSATEKFIEHYNQWHSTSGRAPAGSLPLPPSLQNRIVNDSAHKWPIEMWRAVYDIYNEEMASALRVTPSQLTTQYRSRLKFADPLKNSVACGESFPIESAEKDNYRSQQNRRVVLLFFDQDEVPVLDCPARVTTVHEKHECPLWNEWHFKPAYIDLADLKAVAYHLKFTYFDRIHQAWKDVPEGLVIKAFENGTKEIPGRFSYSNGVYTVKVEENPRTNIHFTFETKDQWIYSADSSTEPVIVTKTEDEMKAMPFAERLKYYDLPTEWSSQNYWTRYDGDMNTGERFEKVLSEEIKGLKPYGGNTTVPDQPLTFSLDDIVLVNSYGNQMLKDKDETGASKDLSPHSRYTLFYLDRTDNHKVKIYKPKTDAAYWTDSEFSENLIHDHHPESRLVVFCNVFYHISDKRTTTNSSFDVNKKHILGARSAVLNDPDCSFFKAFKGNYGSPDIGNGYLAPACGNYELHYLHNCGLQGEKVVCALIIYWSCRFQVDSSQGGIPIDKENYEKYGMENAMERINQKDYQLEKLFGPEDSNFIIKMSAFFEAKLDIEEGISTIKRGGSHKCLVKLCSDGPRSWMSISDALFERSGFALQYPGDSLNNIADFDGSKTMWLTVAHEIGHAIGRGDEYVETDVNLKLPEYRQRFPGMPYSMDDLSLMNTCHATRMRHFWGFANWLNDEGHAGGTLNKFLNGTIFKITHSGLSFELTNSSFRDIYKPAHQSLNHSFGGSAKNDLLLYKLGDDEFAYNLTSGLTYKGILIINTYISAKFIGVNWLNFERKKWLNKLNKILLEMLDNKYRLLCPDENNQFANTYLHFFPQYEIPYGSPSYFTHFTLEITRDNSSNFSPNGSKIEVGNKVNKKKIIRYIFGTSSGIEDLNTNDLSVVKDWIQTVANGSFSIESI